MYLINILQNMIEKLLMPYRCKGGYGPAEKWIKHDATQLEDMNRQEEE